MPVCLPQHDPNPTARRDRLSEHRATYRYAYDWPIGVATQESLNKRDQYPASYVAQVLGLYARLGENMSVMNIKSFDGRQAQRELKEQLEGVGPAELLKLIFNAPKSMSKSMPRRWPEHWSEYKNLFVSIATPAVVSAYDRGGRDLDLAFAWQRVAGVNPMWLTRCTKLPANFPVDGARFTRAMGAGDSLEAALAEHRLYLADYGVLDGVRTGTTDGLAKYIAAPLALFAVERATGALLPVAIQLGQAPGPQSPLVYPDEGWRWRMAQLHVQISDANVHEAVVHLGRTHLVMEAVRVAVEQHLSQDHPLKRLFEPHLETTAAINHSAKTSLIAPGGVVDTCFAPHNEALGALVAHSIATLSIREATPLADLKARGVDDADALPQNPYRDDVLLLWGIVVDFVGEYLDLYYQSDAEVAADYELRHFVHALGNNDGGRLRDVPEVNTVADLKALISRFIYIAGPGHSAVNFPQYPNMGYVANMPGASFSPLMTADSEASEEAFTRMLPPYHIAQQGVATIYLLSEARTSRFGHYGAHFKDLRLIPIIGRLQERLDEAEAIIAGRDPQRLMSYPYLRPSQILQSISI